VKNDGTVETREVRIEVAPPPVAAPIVNYVMTEPEGQINIGACLGLIWDTAGSINRVTIAYNNATIWDYAPLRGRMQHCPPTAGGALYVVTASGPGGTAQGNAYVEVRMGPQPK
jgi:hypothetical protein